MIEVILLERIERLGHMGQLVKVRPGFARNYLLPQQKALRATKANMELFEKQRASLEAKNSADRSNAALAGGKMEGLKLVIVRQSSETGQLYGSVAARDVSDAAKEAGHDIQRLQVQIDTPIKTLGLFPVKVKLHPEVTVKIIVNVARSIEEAAVQDQKNAVVIKASNERAEVEAAFGAPISAAAIEESVTEEKPAKKAKAKKGDDEMSAEKPPDKTKKARVKKSADTE
jgi:large subunit ribosomal protein L9